LYDTEILLKVALSTIKLTNELNRSLRKSEHFPTGYAVMYYGSMILRDCENIHLQPKTKQQKKKEKKMRRRILIFTDFEFHFLGENIKE